MRLLPALTLAIALISTASSQIQTRPPYPVSTEAEAIKQQIIQICLANQTRTEPEKLCQVAGNWYQVWSDAFFYQPTRAFSIDLTKVYQIVFPGYYYNVSPLVTASGTQTLFLKGVYTCSPCSPSMSPGRARSRRAPT